MLLRGTLVYLLLFLFLRFFLKRQTGIIGVADLLVVVLIADAAQNAMGSEYQSVPEGAALVGAIIFWDYALDWLGQRFPSFARLMCPQPLLLIKDGKMLRRNMRQEMITEAELLSQLRQHGVESPDDVKKAYIEGDGSISVIKNEAETESKQKKDKAVA